jgi:hypothetical protein
MKMNSGSVQQTSGDTCMLQAAGQKKARPETGFPFA